MSEKALKLKLQAEEFQYLKSDFEEKFQMFRNGEVSADKVMEFHRYFDEALKVEIEDLEAYRKAELEAEKVIDGILDIPLFLSQVK